MQYGLINANMLKTLRKYFYLARMMRQSILSHLLFPNVLFNRSNSNLVYEFTNVNTFKA